MLFLLKRLHEGKTHSILLEGDESFLERAFERLLSSEQIKIEGANYVLAEKGKHMLQLFRERYTDFLRNFDVYSAVDLKTGEFAFEKYWKIEDEKEWQAYVNLECFEDMRVAVAEYKSIDPVEIVFMSLLNEGRFDEKVESGDSGWAFDLISGAFWRDLYEVVETAIAEDDLGYKSEEGKSIQGRSVLEDIIIQGAGLNRELWDVEEAALLEEDDFATKIDTNFDEYKDPKYKHPRWKNRIANGFFE